MTLSSVDLPQPDGPTKDHELAILDIDVDVFQHVDGAKGLVHACERQCRHPASPVRRIGLPRRILSSAARQIASDWTASLIWRVRSMFSAMALSM